MGRWVWISIIVILLVGIGIVGYFLYINLFSSSGADNSSINQNPINKTVVGVDQINYVLYTIGASGLHNLPLSSNTPKIEMVIGTETYSCEIVDGKVQTKKGKSSEPDLIISMPEQELISAMNSNTKQYLQQSVREGKTNIEILAGKTDLFFKGYLNLYKEITGQTLAGSSIKSFE